MERKNRTPIERLEELDSVLDEYEKGIGLSGYQDSVVDDDVRKYLGLNREQMERLDVEDCAQAAVLLGSFSFHLQRSYNRENTRISWADGVLKKTAYSSEGRYSGSWDSQFYQAINDNTYTKKVLEIKNYAQQRADRIHFLATSVKNMSDLYVNLQRAKVLR